MGLIGGKFGMEVLPEDHTTNEICQLFERAHLSFINARSALAYAAQILNIKNIWFPSYLCPSMLAGFSDMEVKIKIYEVNNYLCVEHLKWVNDVQEKDLVVFIDYFGFPFDTKVMKAVKSVGGYVLEDACQALLTPLDTRFADFTLFSFRKFIGVPDGAVLVANIDYEFEPKKLLPPPTKWFGEAIEALIRRRVFDECGEGNNSWYALTQKVEKEMPVGPYRMSDVSMSIVNSVNSVAISLQRRENYLTLLNELNRLALFSSFPDSVVPLGFPICLKNRDQLQKHLFSKNIFAPIHWVLSDRFPKTSQSSLNLSAEILTIPCDQRYAPKDMLRIIAAINEFKGDIWTRSS